MTHVTGETAHEMPERDDGHSAVVHQNCQRPYCAICEGGLFMCVRCGSTEGATTSECPGVPISMGQSIDIYEGRLDFRDGNWVNACSPHSPAAYRSAK